MIGDRYTQQSPALACVATCAALHAPPLPHDDAGALTLALHEALLPPLLPAQLQVYELPVETALALPREQSPDVGALAKLPPSEDPHAPFTAAGATVAEQEALAPPLLPPQLQVYELTPLATEPAEPVEHRPEDGADE